MMTLNDPPLKSCGKLLCVRNKKKLCRVFFGYSVAEVGAQNLMVMLMMMMSPVFIKEIYEVW